MIIWVFKFYEKFDRERVGDCKGLFEEILVLYLRIDWCIVW